MLSTRYFCPILTKFWFAVQNLLKVSYINFHANRSSGGVADNMRKDRLTDGRTDMMKVVDAFREFANWPKDTINYCLLETQGADCNLSLVPEDGIYDKDSGFLGC